MDIFDLAKNFFTVFVQFCPFCKKAILKKFGSRLLERLRECTILSILYFLYKTIFNWLEFSPCLGLKPLESL